jgi:hypothetical protein
VPGRAALVGLMDGDVQAGVADRLSRTTVVSADAEVTAALPGGCERQAPAGPGAWTSSGASVRTLQSGALALNGLKEERAADAS